MLSTTLISSLLFASLFQNGQCFSVMPLPTTTVGGSTIKGSSCSTSTFSSRLFLEKWVAELIDQELHRQGHKQEYEREWMQKHRDAVVVKTDLAEDSTTLSNCLMLDEDDLANLRQRRKDELLAKNDPQRYCADRCIATGNCDVFEDFLELSAREVMEFCSDCVLSESEDDPCDIPEAFFHDEPVEGKRMTSIKSQFSP